MVALACVVPAPRSSTGFSSTFAPLFGPFLSFVVSKSTTHPPTPLTIIGHIALFFLSLLSFFSFFRFFFLHLHAYTLFPLSCHTYHMHPATTPPQEICTNVQFEGDWLKRKEIRIIKNEHGLESCIVMQIYRHKFVNISLFNHLF